FVFSNDRKNDKSALAEIFSGNRDCYEFNNGYLTSAGDRVWAPLKIVSIPGAGGSQPEVLVGIFAEPVADPAFGENNHNYLWENIRGTNVLDFRRWEIDKRLIAGN